MTFLKQEATDEHVKKAIDQINTPSGEKGGAELVKLNKSIDDLLIAAKKDGKVKDATDAAALALAKGTGTANDEKLTTAESKKDAVIAAGIALRAMAKDGKFIVKDTAEKKTEAESAKGVAASAVGKTLSTLIIAIRDTVDSGLKKINEALATVKQEDKSAEATNTAESTASAQQ
ncbi:variable large family protein (plasmid) [Borrelia miyamotoi]|nr:variable large family protein [Borrelia miyamotoi]QDA32710.2 variable large family protein [Borrelia miyamotoi]WEG95481.1 variable large family protein [Borrelia miyamotoi]